MIDEKILKGLKEFCEEIGGELKEVNENLVACKLPTYDEATVDFTKGRVRVTVEGSDLTVTSSPPYRTGLPP